MAGGAIVRPGRPARAARFLPVIDWGRNYTRDQLVSDLLAALIVTIMLIPQSLAYAMLAGLPPETGLYASILPLLAYALFGSSRVLAVGPVAVISLMTASAIAGLPPGTDPLAAALVLAALSGMLLMALGVLRLGFLANFLSHPVIAGFIAASGLIIAASQVKHILGIKAEGETLVGLLASLWAHAGEVNPVTLTLGLAALAFLAWSRKQLKPLLRRLGLGPRLADLVARAGPIAAVAATSLAAWGLDLGASGVRLVGAVPAGLPPVTWPDFSQALVGDLLGPAALLSIIGFVESVSVAQTLAARKRQHIDPDQEMLGLGAANLAAAATGGFPVTGGFARSVVNADAGAETPAAGLFTAIGIMLATLALTPALAYLPQATLAATIIVAVLSLVDFSILRRSWSYSAADFAAVAATILVTLGLGVEMGVLAGVGLSLLIHLYKTSRPHMAVVGQVPGTEHFRNVERHPVITDDRILSVRVDESLYFANARFLEDRLCDLVADRPDIAHVVLIGTAINDIDLSALESLEVINDRLKQRGIALHLSEIKGPVMDRLKTTDFLAHLTGQVFLSQFQAVAALGGRLEPKAA